MRQMTSYQGQTPGSTPQSDVFDNLQKNLYSDLVYLFDTSNQHDTQLRSDLELMMREQYVLQGRLHELQAYLDSLSISNENLSYQLQTYRTASDHSTMQGSTAARQTHDYGVLSLPFLSLTPRLYHVALDGTHFIPSAVRLRVYEGADPQNMILVESPLQLRMISGQSDHYYMRSSTQSAGVSALYSRIEIAVDPQFVSSLYANMLRLAPLLAGTADILSVQYQVGTSSWHDLVPESTSILRAKATEVHFSPQPITALAVNLRQRFYFVEGGNHVFCYGFKHLGLYDAKFRPEPAHIISWFELSGHVYDVVTGIIPHRADYTPVYPDDCVNTQLLKLDEFGDIQHLDLNIPLIDSPNKVGVLVTLTPSGNMSPVLSGVSISYTT